MNMNSKNTLMKRNIITVLILIITAMMGIYVYQHIYFDSSFNAFVNRENESMKALEEIAVKFGDANMIMLLIDLEEENISDNLKDVDQLISDLKALPFVNAIDSVFNAQKFDGFTIGAPFVKTRPYVTVKDDLYTIDESIFDDNFYVGTVISEDGGTLAVSIRKSAEYESDPLEITEHLIVIINTHIDLEYYLIGEDIVDFEIFSSIQQLTFVYPPIILLAVFCIFMVKFRNLYLSFLTVVSPVIASVWIYFLMLIFDKSINSLNQGDGSFGKYDIMKQLIKRGVSDAANKTT